MQLAGEARGSSDATDTLSGREHWSSAAGGEACAPARLFVAIERHRLSAGGRRLCLDDLDEVIVGRDTVGRIERQGRSALLVVGDIETSRKHLVIRRTGAGWSVEDLGSRNGTVVNGERVDHAMLVDGDWIEAGGAVLQFSIDHVHAASSVDGSR